jgi:Excalibur calcium-binding domain
MRTGERRGGRAMRGGNVYVLESSRRSPRTLVAWFTAALLAGGGAGFASVMLQNEGEAGFEAQPRLLSSNFAQANDVGGATFHELAPVTPARAASITAAGGTGRSSLAVLADAAVTDAPFPVASSGTYWRNCDEARAAGAAPIYVGDPGFRAALDRDGDGIACEPYRGR